MGLYKARGKNSQVSSVRLSGSGPSSTRESTLERNVGMMSQPGKGNQARVWIRESRVLDLILILPI